MLSLVLLIPILTYLPTEWANSIHPTEESITQQSERVHFKCSQPTAEQDALIREAVEKHYLVRRVEFIGNEYTRDNVLRRKIMLEEGEAFTRKNLVKSVESVSKLRKIIYPVKLSDVEIRLDRSDKAVDMTICFKEKPKSTDGAKRSSSKPAS